MKPEVKELWISALKNSDMKQGRGCLKEGNEFCCLGVLTELYRMSSANVKNIDWHQATSISAESFDGTGMFLPKVVAEWAGLPSANKIILNDIWAEKYRLSRNVLLEDINDAGMPFEEIADIIKYQL